MTPSINQILEQLKTGDIQIVYQNAEYLNQEAVRCINLKENATQNDIAEMKVLLEICNITYNDSDRNHLPVEDGVYDLLLEEYKRFDPNFQVGADIVHIKSQQDTTLGNNNSNVGMHEALIFNNDMKDYWYKDDIINPYLHIDERDFYAEANPYPANDPVNTGKRYHDTEHNHPELVGTLDKCKYVLVKDAVERGVADDPNVKILERDFFGLHIQRGIISPTQKLSIVCELKYDGVSVEADCADIVLSARSRGDTGIDQATDMTPFLYGYQFPHMYGNDRNQPIGVKFEAIIQNNDLINFNIARNYNYKNGRSAIVGLTGNGDAYKYRDFITLVPLQVDKETFDSDLIGRNRIAEIEFLNDHFASKGCPLRYAVMSGTYDELLYQINKFRQEAENARPYIPFMYDGIVVSYLDDGIRTALGRENFINKYSMAVKFNPLKKQTIFRGYDYVVGSTGVITPMIHFDPVEFYGTIHTKASGHSYQRFKALDLAMGDLINVEYVNDVMPYVSKAECEYNTNNRKKNSPIEFPTTCPICGAPIWISPTEKQAKCTNKDCAGRKEGRMVLTFSRLNMVGFGEATIHQLGMEHFYQVFEAYRKHAFMNYGFGPGESAAMEEQFNNLVNTDLPDYIFMAAVGFSNAGPKTWQTILSKYTITEIGQMIARNKDMARHMLMGLKRVSLNVVDTIIEQWDYFRPDIGCGKENLKLMITKGLVAKKSIRITGCRDSELFAKLNSLGFDASDSGITKDTDILIVPEAGFTSSKTQKAVQYGITIVPLMDFRANIDRYLY